MALPDAKWIDFTAVDDAGRKVRCHRLIHMLEERRLDGVDKLIASIIGSIDARIIEGNKIEYSCCVIGASEPVLFLQRKGGV